MIFPLPNGVVDLVPMHGHVLWRLDPEANLVTADLDDDEHNVVADVDPLVPLP
jgi:hypothetical protein